MGFYNVFNNVKHFPDDSIDGLINHCEEIKSGNINNILGVLSENVDEILDDLNQIKSNRKRRNKILKLKKRIGMK